MPLEVPRLNLVERFTLKNGIDATGSLSILGKHASVNGHSRKLFHHYIATVFVCPVLNKVRRPQMRVFSGQNRTRLIGAGG